ncbi:MAG: 3-oxo-5-alpha-steroid 4-dehydrogenase [Bacteroidales bacterium]|nr:3-oxo-5-alpha-steroid 4-dehydrogenase [Bacteroidales bacterium]
MHIDPQTYTTGLYCWMGLAVIVFVVLLKVKAPYGRHTTKKWGPLMNNRLGWFVMELPVLAVFSLFFFTGDAEKSLPVYVFYGLFVFHYSHRVFIFPLLLRARNKKMPLMIALLAIFFNLFNGFFNGYWFGHLNTRIYEISWFYDWHFIAGIMLFASGMYLNMASDQRLIHLRNGKRTGYYIPRGGWFNYISSPNLLGEIIEWSGWALMCWCLPTFSFMLWTMVNLIPRALDHHRWYQRNFEEYPSDRKAILPYLL